jgi:hypothetical protein
VRMFIGTTAAVLALLSTARTASADFVFTLSGVTLAGGGTLTGTFSTNNALNTLTGFDITASANGAFPGFHYTTASSTVTAPNLPTFFQLDSPGSADELRLIFNGGLTSSGATLTTTSYEFESAGGVRTVTSGRVTAVPEPGSLTLISGGLALSVAGLVRRRGRRAVAVAA